MNLRLDHSFVIVFSRVMVALALVCALLQWSALPTAAIYQTNLVGPAGSGQFGSSVTALPNGNLDTTVNTLIVRGMTSLS